MGERREGDRTTRRRPRSTFRDFATAAATRYPWVKRWLIWNEPNQVRWLRPTIAPIYTTRLLNPAYAAIHAVIPGAQVAGGGTAPRGSTGGVSPVAWIAGMHAAHARLDAYAHNPYPLDPKRETPLTGGCTHCTTITMATIAASSRSSARELPACAHLADRVRLPDQPARPAARRLAGAAGALRGRRRVRRVPHAKVDLLIHFLVPRRAEHRALPERARHADGQGASPRTRRSSCRSRRSRAGTHRPLGPAARAWRGLDGADRAPRRLALAHGRARVHAGAAVSSAGRDTPARHAGARARRLARRRDRHGRRSRGGSGCPKAMSWPSGSCDPNSRNPCGAS